VTGTWESRSESRTNSTRDLYARTLGKIDFPPRVALSCHRREDLASRRGLFGRFYSGKEAPKPRWAEIAMDAA